MIIVCSKLSHCSKSNEEYLCLASSLVNYLAEIAMFARLVLSQEARKMFGLEVVQYLYFNVVGHPKFRPV